MWILVVPYFIIFLFITSGILFVFRKKIIGVLALSLAIGVNVCTQTIPFHPRSLTKHGDDDFIKVMTWNINSSEIAQDDTLVWKGIIDIIENESPDIISLQEVYKSHSGLLTAFLEENFPHCGKMIRWGDNVIYSKYPVGPVELLKIDTVGVKKPGTKEWWLNEAKLKNPGVLVNNERLLMTTTVYIDGQIINLINCHLASNNFDIEQRSKSKERSWMERIPSYLKNIRSASQQRMAEAIATKEQLEDSDNPSLVCGDMNDLGGSKVLNIIQSGCGLKDAWWTGGSGLGFTYHGHKVMHFRLDHILYSKGVNLQRVWVIKQHFSDHQPLVVTFSLE